MDLTTPMLIGLGGFFIAIYFLLSLTGKTKQPIANRPVMAAVVAVGFIIGLVGTGIIAVDEEVAEPTEQTVIVQQPTTTYADEPKFDITPSTVTSGGYNPFTSLNTGKTIFTIPAWANTTGHTIVEIDNTTWEDPRAQFVVIPIPPSGSDADQLATIWFDVSNYDAQIDADTAATQRLIRKVSGEYQCIWTEGSNTWYIDGSKTMLMTGNATLTLDFDINQGGMAYMEANDPISLTVTFRNNDWTWSKSYSANFVVQQTFT